MKVTQWTPIQQIHRCKIRHYRAQFSKLRKTGASKHANNLSTHPSLFWYNPDEPLKSADTLENQDKATVNDQLRERTIQMAAALYWLQQHVHALLQRFIPRSVLS